MNGSLFFDIHHRIKLSLVGAIILLMTFSGLLQAQTVIWTTATLLAPGLGFWVAPGILGGTEPLGETSRYKCSIVGDGTLTYPDIKENLFG